MKIKPIKAWAVLKGGKLDALEIYGDKDVELSSTERIIRVTITADETNFIKGKTRSTRKRASVCKKR